jgi:hypothetical protein
VKKKIGAITDYPSLICLECYNDGALQHYEKHNVVWAYSDAYPDGYTCDDCGDPYTKNGKLKRKNT